MAKGGKPIATIVGGLAAMVAIAAGTLAGVDPITTLSRAGLAFLLGWFGSTLWYVVLTGPGGGVSQRAPIPEPATAEDDKAASEG